MTMPNSSKQTALFFQPNRKLSSNLASDKIKNSHDELGENPDYFNRIIHDKNIGYNENAWGMGNREQYPII